MARIARKKLKGPFAIDQNVPLPNPRSPRGGPHPYPYHDLLQPGESFFLPGAKHADIHNSITRYRKAHPHITLTVRKQNGGLRIWRIV